MSVHGRRLRDVGCRRRPGPHESAHAGDEDEEPVERRGQHVSERWSVGRSVKLASSLGLWQKIPLGTLTQP